MYSFKMLRSPFLTSLVAHREAVVDVLGAGLSHTGVRQVHLIKNKRLMARKTNARLPLDRYINHSTVSKGQLKAAVNRFTRSCTLQSLA